MSNINDYLPKCLKDVVEFKYINTTLDSYLSRLDGYSDKVQSEVIIDTCTEIGIKKWEDALNVIAGDADTLELRKFRIKSILINKLPYTEWWLKNKVHIITGDINEYNVIMYYDEYAIDITLKSLNIDMLISIEKELREAIPANMELRIGLSPTAESNTKIGVGGRIATHYSFTS